MDTERQPVRKPDPTQPTAPLPPSAPPTDPEPAKETPKRQIFEDPVKPREDQTRKKRGCLLPVVLVVVLAAALFIGYFSIHIWSDGTCTEPMVCRICGAEKDSGLTHVWATASCLDPRTCTICGLTEAAAPGHSWDESGSVCTVCGTTVSSGEGPAVLKQSDSLFDVELTLDSAANDLTIRVPEDPGFASDTISIRDYTDEAVNTERYTVSRDGDAVTIHLPEDLAPGRYTICSGFLEDRVTAFYYGYAGAFLPSASDLWYTDFTTKSWKWDRHLALTAETLTTVETEEGAARFSSPWNLCSVKLTESGAAVDVSSAVLDKFRCDEYIRIDAAGSEQYVLVIICDGWMLASDANGQVYLTDTLSEDCYWLITSGM